MEDYFKDPLKLSPETLAAHQVLFDNHTIF